MPNPSDHVGKIDNSPEPKLEQNKLETNSGNNLYDPLKLLGEAGSLLKGLGSKSVEAFGLPSFEKPGSKDSTQKKTEDSANPGEAKKPAPDHPVAKAESNANDSAQKPKANEKNTAYPETKKPDTPEQKQQKEIADRLIDRIKDSKDPVSDLKAALKNLDNLVDATITMNGRSSNIDIHLKTAQTVAAPNIQVRGFRPVASHIGSHLNFDVTPVNGGVSVNVREGLSSSVQGPLGKIRHSETTGMFIGKDQNGRPYINTSSDLYMRRRVHSSTTTLREENLASDSPMRSMMQHPEALNQVGSMLRMFQGKDDLNKMGIKRSGADSFDVKSEAKSDKHVDLNFKPKDTLVPVTVESLDLAKNLSASLTQDKNSVSLDKINGLKVNVEIAKVKTTVTPSKITVENDTLKIDLKNPEDGRTITVPIPISKLQEAAAKAKR